MVHDFTGFTQGVIGKKLPSDSTLNGMKKSKLIELLHTAQHNYETLNWFYGNAVKVNMDALKKTERIVERLELKAEKSKSISEKVKAMKDDEFKNYEKHAIYHGGKENGLLMAIEIVKEEMG